MADQYLKQSGLAHLALESRSQSGRGDAGVAMGQTLFPIIVNLRGDPKDKAFLAAAERTLGTALPLTPNRTATAGLLTIMWLGPDEWWVVGPSEATGLAETLRQATAGLHAAVTEVGDSRVCLRLTGPRAGDVLAKGCPLDLHEDSFGGPGACAQSVVAKCGVLLHQVAPPNNDGPALDVYALRSFSGYLWAWLEDAAREYQVAVVL